MIEITLIITSQNKIIVQKLIYYDIVGIEITFIVTSTCKPLELILNRFLTFYISQ